MASSPSPFSNSGKLTPTTLVFTQPVNNNLTINNIGTGLSNIRPTTTPNGTILQPISSGVMSTPTSIVRLNQPLVNSGSNQMISQTVWTNNSTSASSPRLQYSPAIKTETLTTTSTTMPQQSTIIPTTLVAKPVIRQPVPTAQPPKFTETQINDFVTKCRTFLITLLKLAEKQAPEKLPMVRSCIQDLLDGTIDPESFTQKLHTLYKSQPHTSLVPFFKLALPYMRQIVKNTFGRAINIELLEKLNLPPSSTTTTATPTRTVIPTSSSVAANPSLISQTSSPTNIHSPQPQQQQPLLYTTVQPQQKINLLQQTPPTQTLISSTTSLLGQQQQLQQQARTQINITGMRPIIATVSPSTNTNLLANSQQHIQPVTQTIIPQSDSLLQRTFFTSSATGLQQPHIITVNPHTIKTEISSTPSISISSLQAPVQKIIAKHETDLSDTHQNLLTTSATTSADDRRLGHDNRFVPASLLRRRFDQLVKNNQRWEGGPMAIHDDSLLALISHATEERMKCLVEQLQSIVVTNRPSRSAKQLTDRDDEEKANTSDHQMETGGEVTQTNTPDNSVTHPSTTEKPRCRKRKLSSNKRLSQAHLRDIIVMMERDKHLRRSTLYFKALDQCQ